MVEESLGVRIICVLEAELKQVDVLLRRLGWDSKYISKWPQMTLANIQTFWATVQ